MESEVRRDYPEGGRDELVVSTPFRAKDSALLGIVQVFHDITERKRAERVIPNERATSRGASSSNTQSGGTSRSHCARHH